MSKLDHTLAATWSSPGNGDKTITGCVVGQPVLFVFNPVGNNGYGWGYIRPVSGIKNTYTGHHSMIGTTGDRSGDDINVDNGGPGVFFVIPTATSVVMNYNKGEGNLNIYVYKT